MQLKQFWELINAFPVIIDDSIFAVNCHISAQGVQIFADIHDQTPKEFTQREESANKNATYFSMV